MLNFLVAKLGYNSLSVKDFSVKFCLHFFHKNEIFVKNFFQKTSQVSKIIPIFASEL
jgi:hypothetical protein